jgi:hypothetical protein
VVPPLPQNLPALPHLLLPPMLTFLNLPLLS